MNIEQSIVARGCLFFGDELLVVKRANEGSADDGHWEIPGGRVEPRENPEETLERECREELGLHVKASKVSRVSSVVYPYAAPKHHVIIIDYIASLHEEQHIQDIQLSSEHTDFMLVASDQIGTITPIREMVLESLKRAFQNR